MTNQNEIKAQYALLARPYLSGSTQPQGETLVERFGNSIHEYQEVAGRKVHAIVEYDRPLYDFEIEQYSLHPVSVPSKADMIQAVLSSYFKTGSWSSHDGVFGMADHGAEGIDIYGYQYGPCTVDGDPSAYDAAEAVVAAYLAGESQPLSDYVRTLFV